MMEDVVGALGGFRGVRADLLVALKKAQPLTAHELAERFGLTPNGLRRHLKVLEEDGLVRYRREVRGVGAPVYAFSLTKAGEALFPRQYLSVLGKALEAVQEHGGDAGVEAVLQGGWADMAKEAAPVLETLPLDERTAVLAELLTARGYMAEAISEPTPTLRIHNCAIREIAERFPQACAVEAKIMEQLLGVPLVRSAHWRDGCGHCDYGVTAHLTEGQEEQA